jgi:competence protein ComEC
MDGAAGTPPSLVAIAIALLAGAVGCLALPALPSAIWSVLAVLVAGLLAMRRHVVARVASVFLAGAVVTGVHAAWVLSAQLPADDAGMDVRVTGRIAGLPEHGTRRTQFLLLVDDVPALPPSLRGRRIRVAWYDGWAGQGAAASASRRDVAAGSRWAFDVRLRGPRGLRNPGGTDAERHALAARIVATGYVRDTATARALAGPVGIDAWRERMSARIAGAVESPSARFVRALALGDTRALRDDDWDVLRANGLTHLVAISGFHVGLVAGFVALLGSALWWCCPGLSKRIPRPHAAALSALAGAVGYAAVAGFALPTVRTALMVAIVVGARVSRRAHGAAGALALAVVAVVLVDPLSLLGAGFWLSFAGVAWLLWCLPRVEGNPVRGLLDAQLVASIGLLPLTVFLFDQASLAGPLANLVAVPWWSLVVVPLALVGTGLEAIHVGAGAWAWSLAAWAFDLSWPLFEWLHGTGLALWWPAESRWFALPLALAGAFWLLLPRGMPGKPLAALLWLPLLWPARQLPAQGGVELEVLDVGHGLAVLVRTQGHALLYDMGPAVDAGFDAGERVVVPALRARGVRRLDAAVISHGDADHAGGWPSVQRAFDADAAWAPEGSPVAGDRACVAGVGWTWDGVGFRFLHPPPAFPYFGNEASCVLRIESAHGSVLLAGDVGKAVERMLVRRDPDAVAADVVVVAHHGSRGSSDPRFVAATGARFALVAAGSGGRFRLPHPEVVARWRGAGAALADTADTGALRVRIGPADTTVEGRRATHPRLWDAVRRRDRGTGVSCRPDRGAPGAGGHACWNW